MASVSRFVLVVHVVQAFNRQIFLALGDRYIWETSQIIQVLTKPLLVFEFSHVVSDLAQLRVIGLIV